MAMNPASSLTALAATDVYGADVYTESAGLERLKSLSRKDQRAALEGVARQFESLLLQQMLKSMRSANLGDSMFDSNESKFYRDMMDQQMGINLSQQQGLGLAKILVQQLSRQFGLDQQTSTTEQAPSQLPPVASMPAALQRLQPAPAVDGKPAAGLVIDVPDMSVPRVEKLSPSIHGNVDKIDGSPEAFVRVLWPHAQQAARELNVDPEILIAQSALETGWGRSVIDGGGLDSSYNLFGIKAGSGWDGGRASASTLEFEEQSGVMTRQRASFRTYESWRHSFNDYVQFLKTQPRYRDALDHGGDSVRFVEGLQQAGYATDPRYADKIVRIATGPEMLKATSALRA